jgi:hypothetical protein
LSLTLILLCLISGKLFKKDIQRLWRSGIISSPDETSFQALADSLARRTGLEFQLSDSVVVDSLLDQPGGPIYRRIRIPWPKHLPFEFYARRLRKLCVENQLSCDCVESSKERQMTCSIRGNGLIGALAVVKADGRIKLKGREIAIVIKNLGLWNNDDILETLEADLLFAYIGSPNTFPTGKMKSALESAGIITILELPREKTGLVEFRDKKNKSKRGKDLSVRELWADIFERHPNIKAIYFDKSYGCDLAFVKTAISQAAENNVAFIYKNSEPDEVDSLAYSGGLDIIRFDGAKNIADFDNLNLEETKAELLAELILPGKPHKLILTFDAAKTDHQAIIRLYDSLLDIGINPKSYIDLVDTLESF